MDKRLPNNTFYNELVADYDEMISFDSAVNKKENLLRKIVIQDTKSAADIGCGSGVDSIALALLRVKVSAFDPSTEMLKVAKVNSNKMNIKIDFYNYSADNISEDFNNQFDLVVLLGNTFANISQDKFTDSIKRCYDILKPQGRLLIQVLNYEKILIDKQRIMNITEASDKYFIRFYDFLNEQMTFNILTFSKVKPFENKLISTKIYLHYSENFFYSINYTGFSSIRFYSNLELSDFNPEKSKDLVILAFRK